MMRDVCLRILAVVGMVLSSACALSLVGWVGVMRSDESLDAKGYLWGTDRAFARRFITSLRSRDCLEFGRFSVA
jgi:hypothetical protein